MKRRSLLKLVGAAGVASHADIALLAKEAAHVANFPMGKAEHVIHIWLGGGAAQVDTWDPKALGDPKAKKAGSYYPSIDTSVPGVKVTEHLSRCAKLMEHITAMRTVNHDVIDEHAAASNRMHTGRNVSGTTVYPSLGSMIASERGAAAEGVPAYVLIGYPNFSRGPGFLGAKAGFLYLLDTDAGPAGLKRPEHILDPRQSRREQLLGTMRQSAKELRTSPILNEYDTAMQESLALAGPEFMEVFNLKSEKGELRSAYGSEFGQRCLLARRLIQRGVRFIEVSFNLNFINGTGWDTHLGGQKNQHLLIQDLDRSVSNLVLDLERHKLLDKTLIVIATEFGRPPEFDGGGGRGHQSKAFSIVLAGGGLRTGQVVGTTDELAKKIVDAPMSVPDMHATIHCALGINPEKANPAIS